MLFDIIFENMEFDDPEECFEIDSIADDVGKLDDKVEGSMKDLMHKMMRMIIRQDGELRKLKQNQGHMKDLINVNTNAIHKLDERTVELEKYSRKLCLIFYNVECKGDALSSIIFLFKQILQLNFNPTSLAACHPLKRSPNAPIIVKFIYHQDRDLIWRRRTWLKGVSNSIGRPVQVEECLSPRDREVRAEAKQMGLLTFTKRQDVYAYNQNLPNTAAVQVKSTNELRDFVAPVLSNKSSANEPRDFVAPVLSNKSFANEPRDFFAPVFSNKLSAPAKSLFESDKLSDTPMQMPSLTRKPMSTVTQSVKRKRIQLSPAMESLERPDDNPNLVNDIVKSLVPAIVLALKEVTKETVADKTTVDTDLEVNATDKNSNFRNAENAT